MINQVPVPVRRRGFTLIEVLLAVSIFAIVLGAINSVFFAALRLRNKTTESIEKSLPIQQALGFIQRDLEGLMLPGGRLGGSFNTSPQGVSNTVAASGARVTPDLYTTTGNVGELARWADVQKVAYFLAIPTNSLSDTGDGKDLVRHVTRNLLPVNTEEVEVQHLVSGVETMRLEYFDGLAWTDSWDSNVTTNLPNAVRVHITLEADDAEGARTPAPIELIVPVLVVAGSTVSTNNTEQGGSQ